MKCQPSPCSHQKPRTRKALYWLLPHEGCSCSLVIQRGCWQPERLLLQALKRDSRFLRILLSHHTTKLQECYRNCLIKTRPYAQSLFQSGKLRSEKKKGSRVFFLVPFSPCWKLTSSSCPNSLLPLQPGDEHAGDSQHIKTWLQTARIICSSIKSNAGLWHTFL